MPLATFVLNNAELGFIERIVGRPGAGSRVLDVVVSACRTLQAQDWTSCDHHLTRADDHFEVRFHRPENAQQFRLDIQHDGLEGLEVLTGRVQPLDDVALAAVLSTRSIAFVGCARQCAEAVATTVRKLDALGRLFGRHELIVFENDSTDGTAERLQALAADYPVRLIQAPGLGRQLTQRTARLAYGRNALIEAAMATGADYVCVADMDGVLNDAEPDAASFTDAFRREACWDAVFPVNAGMYYDIWALRHPVLCPTDFMTRGTVMDASLGRPLAVHFAASSIQVDLRSMPGWLPVESAFGGMGVYKREALAQARYVGLRDGREICEHVPLHEQMRRQGRRLYISPAFIVASHGHAPQATHHL